MGTVPNVSTTFFSKAGRKDQKANAKYKSRDFKRNKEELDGHVGLNGDGCKHNSRNST